LLDCDPRDQVLLLLIQFRNALINVVDKDYGVNEAAHPVTGDLAAKHLLPQQRRDLSALHR
jgi:hypothetical protein